MDRDRAAESGRSRSRMVSCSSPSWVTRRACGPARRLPSADATGGRISIFRRDGTLLHQFGGGLDPCAPGDFYAPHDLCVDSRGDLYVGEVTWSAGGNRGLVPADCHSLQKFVVRTTP